MKHRPVTAFRLLPAGLVLATLAACSTAPLQTPVENRGSAKPAAPQASRPAPATPSRPASVATAPGKRGGGYYLDDGPHEDTPVNLDAIPDAVPRIEPVRAANSRPYTVMGQDFKPLGSVQPFSETGVGSWYGRKFHGQKTSSGEDYDMFAMSAAHPTLPIPSYARVTNLENGRSVVVRVNDRGPFLHSRIIDLSYTAAWKLGYADKGSARLQVEAIVPDELDSLLAINSDQLGGGMFAPVQPAPAPAPATPVAAARPAPVAAPAAAQAAAPAPAGEVFLQLGAFASGANAESFREFVVGELKWLQQDVRAQLIGDKYRLRVGPFRDALEAREISGRIAAVLGVQPFVVSR